MQVYFPFHLDGRGLVAEASYSQHIRHLIEQLLFTAPGERVNRPDFGCGLLQVLFGPGSAQELIATQYLVEQALQKWLGELIELRGCELEQQEEKLLVVVRYVERQTGAARQADFEVSVI